MFTVYGLNGRVYSGPLEGLMWTPVPSVQPDTPNRHLAQVLLDLHLPGLPVLDDAGALQGLSRAATSCGP